MTDEVNAGRALADLIDTTLADYLATHPLHIDKIWGALEAGTAKALRGLTQLLRFIGVSIDRFYLEQF